MSITRVSFEGLAIGALPQCPSLEAGLSAKEDVFIPIPEQGVLQGRIREIFCEGAKIQSENRMGAARVMMPFHWLDEPWRGSGVGLSILHDPIVFGGRISRRTSRTHHHGQCLVRSSGHLLEDSFGVMDGARTYSEDILSERGDGCFQYIGPEEASARLTGDYLFLGNAHHHFGHFMLEGLSRLWAYRSVCNYCPNIRIIIYEPDAPPFIYQLLEMAGVHRDQIIFATRATVCERLIVPRMAMRTHHWVTSFQKESWGSLSQNSDGGNQKKIFLSRRNILNRRLKNEDYVAELFRKSGFVVVNPENLSIAEQVKLASSASVLAGAVGSQMYLSAFMRPGGRVLVVAPENFYLKDDFLIAAATGLKLKVQFGTPIDFAKMKNERHWEISAHAVQQLLEEGGVR